MTRAPAARRWPWASGFPPHAESRLCPCVRSSADQRKALSVSSTIARSEVERCIGLESHIYVAEAPRGYFFEGAALSAASAGGCGYFGARYRVFRSTFSMPTSRISPVQNAPGRHWTHSVDELHCSRTQFGRACGCRTVAMAAARARLPCIWCLWNWDSHTFAVPGIA